MPLRKRSPNGHFATSSHSMICSPPPKKTNLLCILSNSQLTTKRVTLEAGASESTLPAYLLNNMIEEGADLTNLRKRGHGAKQNWLPRNLSATYQEE